MGHGHVTPNLDGSKARCGGPALCAECAKEEAALKRGKMEGKEIGILDLIERIDALRSEVFGLKQRLDQLTANVQPAIEQTARIGCAD